MSSNNGKRNGAAMPALEQVLKGRRILLTGSTGFLGKAALLCEREAYAEADAMLCDIVQSWPDSAAAAGLWGRCATALKNWAVAGSRWEGLLARHPADRGFVSDTSNISRRWVIAPRPIHSWRRSPSTQPP